jgi:serine/threonine protein kinase/uncharacterized membrane protein
MAVDSKRVKEVFLEAAELSDEAARAAYLDKACGADAGVRERVEALLRSHDPAGSFLGTPAAVVPDPDRAAIGDLAPASDHAATRTSDGGAGASDDEALTFLAPPTRPDALGRIGHYEVLQVLGKGGFGIVFRAFDEILQRVVALKVMGPQLAATSPARKRFLREARSSAQVRHENVVQVYEVAEQPLPYLAMEFIPGETLQQKLDRVGPLDVPEVLRIGRQIAEGLAAAHATDLIHRDIKPGNVLLEGGQQKVKITDFGLARTADDASISQSGIIAGTPLYMAPEQALGQTLDQRADLFSLGSVLYQMVAGRPPFRANGTLAVLKRVAEDKPRAIREIIPETPQWLCDIIAKLHAKNPDGRYQSAREVADVLADCEAQLKANSKLKDFSRIPRSKSQHWWRWRWVAAAVLLLPVVALAATEYAGVTHWLRGRESMLDQIKPGNGPASIAKVESPKQDRGALAKEGDPDRKAAEYVLSIGGTVRVDGGDRDIRAAQGALPAGVFRLTCVHLSGNNQVTDAGLVAFKDCKNLTTLELDGCRQITDAGLARFNDCKNLTSLDLHDTRVGDAGLAHFKDCKAMTELHLTRTKVSDAGLAHFKDCKNLTSLYVDGTPVGDASLIHFKDCKNLTSLNLNDTRVSDAGLCHFQDCKNLTHLDLARTRVSDMGLAHFRDCKNLTELHLDGTRVGDAGLIHFKDCKNLTSLKLNKTRVSDAGLIHFKDCKALTELNLARTRLSDVGLAHFKDCKNLENLHLDGTQVGDAGLAQLKGIPLTVLWIDNTSITDLIPLQGMPLEAIYLSPKKITRGLDILRDMKSLKIIGIAWNQTWPPAEFWKRYDNGKFK